MYTEEQEINWLHKSKVANDLGHYEDGKLNTAVTSLAELRALIELAYDQGMQDGRDREALWQYDYL